MNRLNDLVEFWFAWLLHSGWQAAVVVAGVTVLLLLVRRGSAQFRHALLLIALAKFAAPAFLSLPVGLFSQSRSPVATEFTIELAARDEVHNNDEVSVMLPSDDEARGSAPINPTFAPPCVKLLPEYFSRQSATELRSAGGSGASGSQGTAVSSKLSVALSEVNLVRVRFVLESPGK